MYQPGLSTRDKLLILAAIIIAEAVLVFALVNLSPKAREVLPEEVIEIFDVTTPAPPPPPVVVEVPKPDRDKPKEAEGAASAKNIRSKATHVAAPKPAVVLPVPPPVTASPTPNQGSDRTQGASNVVGPGTGAGGVGTGTGSGGSGAGTGGGGGGGSGVKLVRDVRGNDYPPAITRRWPRGGRIFVRVRVQPDGRVSQCDVMRSFGDKEADDWTCSLVMRKAVFRPATDAAGRPIAAWYGYIQGDTGDYIR